jgi:hypothetical protein
MAALRRLRFGFVTPQLAVLPNRGAPLPRLPGYLFSAVTADDLWDLLKGAWPLAALRKECVILSTVSKCWTRTIFDRLVRSG